MNSEARVDKPIVFRIEQVSDKHKTKRMQWTKQHDETLKEMANKHKYHNWGEVAKTMSEKFKDLVFTSKKCRARWKNCINPELSKQYLNDAEELLLVAYHSTYKNKWSKISKRLPHRNSNILRNSFYGSMRKIIQLMVLDKKRNSETTPLEFIQVLYIGIFITELLDLPNSPAHKNSLVPLYIYLHVKEKKVTKEKCIDYIEQIKAGLLAHNPSRKPLQILKEFTYDMVMTQFFPKFVAIVKSSVAQLSFISDDFIYEMMDRALTLAPPPNAQIVCPLPPSPLPQNFPLMLPTISSTTQQTLPSMVSQIPPMYFFMGNQLMPKPMVIKTEIMQPMFPMMTMYSQPSPFQSLPYQLALLNASMMPRQGPPSMNNERGQRQIP